MVNILTLFFMISIVMNWNVEAKSTQWTFQNYQSEQKIFKSNEKEFTGKFLHFTDIHLDPSYLPNSMSSEFCHRYGKKSKKKSKKNKSGKFGTPNSQCDTPYTLTNSTFSFLKENFQDVDFIIYTGDNLRHERDPKLPLTEDFVKWCHETIVKYVTDTFDMNKTKFIPTIGNNDEWGHNQLEDGPNTLFGNLTQIWAPLKLNLTPDFINGGYFRQDISPKLSVLSLNSMYFYNLNKKVKDCNHQKSPGAVQLKWIERQLESARKEGRKVFIAQHVPLLRRNGNPTFYNACQVEYVQLIGGFSDVISGHFSGHTNLDTLIFVTESKQFRGDYNLLYLNSNERPSMELSQEIILVLNNAPSIVPVHNSGIREYRYSTSGSLIDYIQYYADIKKANKKGKVKWEIEYIASETYGMKQLSPSEWSKVLDKMKENDNKFWKAYLKYVTVSGH